MRLAFTRVAIAFRVVVLPWFVAAFHANAGMMTFTATGDNTSQLVHRMHKDPNTAKQLKKHEKYLKIQGLTPVRILVVSYIPGTRGICHILYGSIPCHAFGPTGGALPP